MTSRRFLNTVERRASPGHIKEMALTRVYVEKRNALNVGCGIGCYEFLFNNHPSVVVAIDVDKKALKYAVKRLRLANFVLANALFLPFRGEVFDVVTCWDTIEHLPRRTEVRALREMNRVSKYKAYLFISTPNDTCLLKTLDPAYFLRAHRHYSASLLCRYVEWAGYRVECVTYGGKWIAAMFSIVYYTFKTVGLEIPLREWFMAKLEDEYFNQNAFCHVFLRAKLIRRK